MIENNAIILFNFSLCPLLEYIQASIYSANSFACQPKAHYSIFFAPFWIIFSLMLCISLEISLYRSNNLQKKSIRKAFSKYFLTITYAVLNKFQS